MLPLRLDNTEVPGITDNILYENWENNPNQIAKNIQIKLKNANKNDEDKEENTRKGSQNIINRGNIGEQYNIQNLKGNFNKNG